MVPPVDREDRDDPESPVFNNHGVHPFNANGLLHMKVRLVDESGVIDKPVVMTHGYEDSSMPFGRSQQPRDFLLRYGVDVEHYNFHMDHTIAIESLAAVKIWLEKQLRS